MLVEPTILFVGFHLAFRMTERTKHGDTHEFRDFSEPARCSIDSEANGQGKKVRKCLWHTRLGKELLR